MQSISLAPLVGRDHHVRAVGRGDEDVELPEAVGEAVKVDPPDRTDKQEAGGCGGYVVNIPAGVVQ